MAKRFPHLLPEDAALWQRFLHKYGKDYKSYEYDVRVGQGYDPGPTQNPMIRKMSLDLSMRRIDVIATNPNAKTVIEVSKAPSITQIGQLVTYPILYRQTYSYTGTLKTLLVAETISPDIQTVMVQTKTPWILMPT